MSTAAARPIWTESAVRDLYARARVEGCVAVAASVGIGDERLRQHFRALGLQSWKGWTSTRGTNAGDCEQCEGPITGRGDRFCSHACSREAQFIRLTLAQINEAVSVFEEHGLRAAARAVGVHWEVLRREFERHGVPDDRDDDGPDPFAAQWDAKVRALRASGLSADVAEIRASAAMFAAIDVSVAPIDPWARGADIFTNADEAEP